MGILKWIKNWLYYCFVTKDTVVCREFIPYKDVYGINDNRGKRVMTLLKLKWHYHVLGRVSCLLPEMQRREKSLSLEEDMQGVLEDETGPREKRKRILFISHDLGYTGAPHSLLRMCKVSKKLGYEPHVWSIVDGPFSAEFSKNKIPVTIVPEGLLCKRKTIRKIRSYSLAVCNTVLTDAYERVCSRYIPTVWYIREASNLPEFIEKNWKRRYTLKHSRSIYSASEYAAEFIMQYAKHPVQIIRNCIEDESDKAQAYQCGSGERVSFVQFGTITPRKGYDVLLEAFQQMPERYRLRSELYFAGDIGDKEFCSSLFEQMKQIRGVYYLGEIRSIPEKIKSLSTKDVVIVASRDESCSLVALEGAMLSKPLIVTENVGAKYIVSEENGCIVRTGDAESLKIALMRMIDQKYDLAKMGKKSREKYEKYASMDKYTADMRELLFKANETQQLYERMRTNLIYNPCVILFQKLFDKRN